MKTFTKKLCLAMAATFLLLTLSIICFPETGYAGEVWQYKEYEWNNHKSKTTNERFGSSRQPATYSASCNHLYTRWVKDGVLIYGKDNSSFAKCQWWCDSDWYPDDLSVTLCYDYLAQKGYSVSVGLPPSASITLDYQYCSNQQTFSWNNQFELYIRPDEFEGGIISIDTQCLYTKASFHKNNIYYTIQSRY